MQILQKICRNFSEMVFVAETFRLSAVHWWQQYINMSVLMIQWLREEEPVCKGLRRRVSVSAMEAESASSTCSNKPTSSSLGLQTCFTKQHYEQLKLPAGHGLRTRRKQPPADATGWHGSGEGFCPPYSGASVPEVPADSSPCISLFSWVKQGKMYWICPSP